MYKRIYIFHNKVKKSLAVKNQVMSLLRKEGYILTKENPDIIVVIGGDGTMLSAIRTMEEANLPFLGVNTGNLGFLPGLLPDEIHLLPTILREENPVMDEFCLLEVVSKTISGKEVVNYVFNEAVIKHYHPKMLEAHIYIDGKPFNYFTGDGLIFSTPIGTTGYAIWAGGAAIHWDLPCFQITPLQPNDNRINRPLKNSMVIPAGAKVTIKVVKARFRSASVACDGVMASREYIEELTISTSDKKVRIMRAKKQSYFELYRNKIIDKHIFRYLEEEDDTV
ncbi:MAG: NAD(+)/NADH kinase [Tissierellia bacterium]|nr:NAD(+)/NADH kinase [Tissierellia bacterium]